jgi:hypothetical protein
VNGAIDAAFRRPSFHDRHLALSPNGSAPERGAPLHSIGGCVCGRLPSGSRYFEPTREKVHPDDLKNPDYRKGRYRPFQPGERRSVRRPPPTDYARRAQFAAQTARAEFGRFYWNGEMGRRMAHELKVSRRQKREAEKARRRKPNGSGR